MLFEFCTKSFVPNKISTFQRWSCHIHPALPSFLFLSLPSTLLFAISSSHHHYWGPFVWRSYPSSSPAWIHPLASSSQMTPSCRWPERWERKRRRERDWLGGRWQENKKDKWIQASRDPLRRLSRKEVKHNWTKKNKVTAAFKMLINSLSESPHDSLTFVAPDAKSCSLGSFSRNTHAAFVCL